MLLPENGYVWSEKGILLNICTLCKPEKVSVLIKDKHTKKLVYTLLPIKRVYQSDHSISMLKSQQRYEGIETVNMPSTTNVPLFLTREKQLAKQLFFLIKYIYLPAQRKGNLKETCNLDYKVFLEKETFYQFIQLISDLQLPLDRGTRMLTIPGNLLRLSYLITQIHGQGLDILDHNNDSLILNTFAYIYRYDLVYHSVIEKALLEGHKVIPIQQDTRLKTLIEKGRGQKGLQMDKPRFLVNVDFDENIEVKAIPILYTAKEGNALGARWVTN